jgi:glycolate oxidase FAD binding subunit
MTATTMPIPSTPAELAESLQSLASRKRPVTIAGASSKKLMAGPIEEAECLSTTGLHRVLQYEPRDLTISVEAGFRWRELTRLLGENKQMVPLDPPFSDEATVGGVIASNSSGPRRRLFGTARDLVIGMQFATLEGKLVQSGGMVVKNVAGLDMGKLMIGSFGTLAAIAVVNFKLQPLPPGERSFLLPFPNVAAAIQARNQLLASPLQPAAIDLLNPLAGSTLGNNSWLLAIRAGGNAAAVDRYEREFSRFDGAVAFELERHETLWKHIENLTPRFLSRSPDGAIVRASCTLKEVEAVMGSFEGPALARAGSGVCYGYWEQAEAAAAWVAQAAKRGWKAVIEFAPEQRKRMLELWPSPGGDLEIMRRVKTLFDPANLLNRGRLYRLI